MQMLRSVQHAMRRIVGRKSTPVNQACSWISVHPEKRSWNDRNVYSNKYSHVALQCISKRGWGAYLVRPSWHGSLLRNGNVDVEWLNILHRNNNIPSLAITCNVYINKHVSVSFGVTSRGMLRRKRTCCITDSTSSWDSKDVDFLSHRHFLTLTLRLKIPEKLTGNTTNNHVNI